MEKILIINSPEGKNTAQKIQTLLKKEGFGVTLGATRVDVDSTLPDLVIAVFSVNSESDATMMRVLKGCNERSITVVPFVTVAMNKTVSQDYYLNEHVWIDNIATPFDESWLNLIDLIKKNYPELSRRQPKREPFKKSNNSKTANKNSKSVGVSEKEKLYRNIMFVCFAVILVMLFILLNGGMKQTNREVENYKNNSSNAAAGGGTAPVQLSLDMKNSEQALVGRWKMVAYSDNQFRATRQDSLDLEALVNSLISRAELIFNSDKTFQRIGFSDRPEVGNWEYDSQSKYLKLQPMNVNQYDVVQLQEVNDTRLIVVVQEKLDNNTIFTKLTFEKVR